MKPRALRIIDDYLPASTSAELLATIARYRRHHEPPLIDRAVPGRSLRYRVIDGHAVARDISELEQLYLLTGKLIGEWSGYSLAPIEDRVAGINVNITPPGGEYRWHYDRNEVTAIVYLNEVAGGVTEVYANHRILLPPRLGFVQSHIDAVLSTRLVRAVAGTKSVVSPRVGRLVIMRGDRCLHSVCPVEGSAERINICMAYDRVEEPRANSRRALDAYLYTEQSVGGPDPNYLS